MTNTFYCTKMHVWKAMISKVKVQFGRKRMKSRLLNNKSSRDKFQNSDG